MKTKIKIWIIFEKFGADEVPYILNFTDFELISVILCTIWEIIPFFDKTVSVLTYENSCKAFIPKSKGSSFSGGNKLYKPLKIR